MYTQNLFIETCAKFRCFMGPVDRLVVQGEIFRGCRSSDRQTGGTLQFLFSSSSPMDLVPRCGLARDAKPELKMLMSEIS